MAYRTGVVFCLALAACAHATSAGAPSPGNPLIGTWQLIRVVAIRPSGEATVSGFGKNPAGYITYTQDGHMAAQIMSDPHPKARDSDHPTPEELAAMLDHYMAYAGTYDYDPATRSVTHHLQLSNDPADVGRDLVRKVGVDGDRVTLTTIKPYALGGEMVVNQLTWQRLR